MMVTSTMTMTTNDDDDDWWRRRLWCDSYLQTASFMHFCIRSRHDGGGSSTREQGKPGDPPLNFFAGGVLTLAPTKHQPSTQSFGLTSVAKCWIAFKQDLFCRCWSFSDAETGGIRRASGSDAADIARRDDSWWTLERTCSCDLLFLSDKHTC